jgi:hypothetical protein
LNNGQATLATSTLSVGSHTITVSYGGDANNSAATSAPLTQVVNKATPVIPPPVVSSSTPPPNTPVTITETVPSGVTGTVTFSNGTTPIGTGTIVNGVATITVPSLPIGTNSITATTSGDINNNPATSLPTQVTVSKAVAVVITLTSSVNPAAPNQAITFAATIQAGATGSVTFLDGTSVLGTGTINAAGIATFTTSSLTIGSHPITATYGGDSGYGAATSAVLTQVVGKIPTVTTIIESAPAQLLHSGVTFTATITAPSPNATGTVTFMDGTTVIGTAPIANGGGVVSLTTNANAAFATSSLVTGPHQIVAVYSGDNNFAPSTSAPTANMVEDFTNTNSGPASQSILAGATTTYKFTLAPVSATTFLNDVTVTVAGLPAGSTYTFTPSTVAAGSGSTEIVLNVQTSSSLSARNNLPQNRPSSRNELPIALGMLGLAGLGTARKMRRKLPRSLMLLLLTLGSLLPIAALSGCAGGYFLPKPTTYSLTVTGTEGAIQHAATATLIVEQ